MNRQFLTDQDVEAAFDWLEEHANAVAKARAERLWVEEFRHSKKAMLMKEHPGLSVAAQEREAYADPRYIEHLEAIKIAVFEDERLRFLREDKHARIDAWRSASANSRVRV